MRTTRQRRADTLQRLDGDAYVWIATSSADGVPHLVPLSLAWDGERLFAATPASTPTARNATATGVLKASLESADDVVLIDATVEVVDYAAADPALASSFVQRVGWDPSDDGGDWSLLIITPRTVRAWHGEPEIVGRTIMRGGMWVDDPA